MKSETPQQLADRLKFEYDASQNMDGILYQDENRKPEPKLATDKIVQNLSSGSRQNEQNGNNTLTTGEQQVKVNTSEVATQKPILQVKPLTNNKEQKVDSADQPDIKLTDIPYYERK